MFLRRKSYAQLLSAHRNAVNRTTLFRLFSKETVYERKTPLEHVLLRPGMYVGQTEVSSCDTWLLNEATKKMEKQTVNISPALLKIFDEIVVNAADNRQRDAKMSKIEVKVAFNEDKLVVSVENDGKGIPVQMHPKEKLYVPELIFGHLLTGSNFDDSVSRLTGGSHGYGAKLTNMFSLSFQLETFDVKRKLLFKQNWSNNMTEVGTAEVTQTSLPHSYTRITFQPDLARLGFKVEMDSAGGLSAATKSGIVDLFRRRCVDIAACTSPLNVEFNSQLLPVHSFEDYASLYSAAPLPAAAGDELEQRAELPDEDSLAETAGVQENQLSEQEPNFYIKVNSRWEVAVKPSLTGAFEAMSFVNCVWTARGGTHVSLVTAQVTKAFEEALRKRGVAANANLIRSKLMVFVHCQVENPSFEGQSKDLLNSKPATYGSNCVLPDSFLKRVVRNSGILESLLADISFMERRKLAASSRSSNKQVIDVPKLQDALLAGSDRSLECTLVLTEGDSAKALAVAGLEVVGRDLFGVLPLRGKVLNVRIASRAQLLKNEEIINLCKALGLDFNRSYENGLANEGLRYGQVLIMCDQDNDGSHIKGLLINLFHHFWPSLLAAEGFLQQFITPIVKVRSGASKKLGDTQSFYSIPEYLEWRNSLSPADVGRKHVKYYKGLGTNTAEEGKEYFRHLDKHRKLFYCGGAQDDAIDLAFSKTRAEDRKTWLTHVYDPATYLDPHAPRVSYEEFVDKELICFSVADNTRSLPCVVDGLKPSQRKVLFGCFKKNAKEEVKVVQMAGYIAEHTAYHHGEASLHSTIINMAQDFVGSNNVPFLVPSGQFGTRAQGGKDHASPRYIFTSLSPLTRALFPPEDDALLQYQEEDGQKVEPKFFVPVIPTLLLNGSQGIGTGWSTSIPAYNLLDITKSVENRLRGVSTGHQPLLPWVRGFSGSIVPSSAGDQGVNSFSSVGVVSRTSKTSVEISELPCGRWTDDYKASLCAMVAKGEVKSFTEHHTTETVRFVVHASGAALDAMEQKGLVRAFKLEAGISLNNMHAFDCNGLIVKYESPEEIMDAHFDIRMHLYAARKRQQEESFAAEEQLVRNKSRFIRAILSGSVDILSSVGGKSGPLSEGRLVDTLRTLGFATSGEIGRGQSTSGVPLEAEQRRGIDKAAESAKHRHGYEYLLNMAIHSLTEERSVSLEKSAAEALDKLQRSQRQTERDLWLGDLGHLEKKYLELYGHHAARQTTS